MMIWLAVFLPLFGAFLNGIILPRSNKSLSHWVGALSLIAAFICSVFVFKEIMASEAGRIVYYGFNWLSVGSLKVDFSLVGDRLSGLMLLIVTGIGSLIHIYAGGYMHDQERTYRFFSYLNLFVFMMLLLVLGENLLIMFVGWEGVGLCSYLLIGYWFEDIENAKAGMKAFIVNRIGDIGFLFGIFLTQKTFSTLSFHELMTIVEQSGGEVNLAIIGVITLCFFVGACGKSAQLPLYVWLPDAMAGPTPVSALIHAATMVTAGVYMMTRLHFLYYLAPASMEVVAFVGCLTAFFAATVAITQTDIKKVLAYSTVSQLGYMVLACGVGAFDAAMFHLFTHACFKALLFLGAGSVIVAMHHEQDMRAMGGLKRYLPITHAQMLIGVLAIIGTPGLSGFFSKDEILWKAFIFPKWGVFFWIMGVITAAMTAFYMVRLLCLTFYGKNRSDKHTREHLHEVASVMWLPLTVLAFLSIFVGFLGVPDFMAHLVGAHNYFADYLSLAISVPETAKVFWGHLTEHHSHAQEWGLMGASVAIVFISALTAISFYRDGFSSRVQRIHAHFPKLHVLLSNKYWGDEFYNSFFVKNLNDMALFLWKIIDIKGINGALNGVAHFFNFNSAVLSHQTSGDFQKYLSLFLFALLGFFLVLV